MRTNPVHIPACSVEADHLLVVLSDIEMGAGGPTDDFPQTEFLGELLLAYNQQAYADIAVTIVANGDTMDLLKTSLDGVYPIRINVASALEKLERIFAAHSRFFDQLGELLTHEGAARQLVFLAGNLELLFPEVQARVRERIGSAQNISFAGHGYSVGDVWIEHGSQQDPLFAADAEQPFLECEGETILNLPWGTLALLEVALPLTHMTLHALDRFCPRREVFRHMPEVQELLLRAYWRYWTRDYWRGLLARTDQLHRISWAMMKEVAHRFVSGDPELAATDARRLLRRTSSMRTYVVGHQHSAGFWSQDDRRVLQTGCFRNEYLYDEAGGDHRLLPKVFAEIYLNQGRTVRAHLVEVDAPLPLVAAVPRRIQDALPEVRRLLQGQRA